MTGKPLTDEEAEAMFAEWLEPILDECGEDEEERADYVDGLMSIARRMSLQAFAAGLTNPPSRARDRTNDG